MRGTRAKATALLTVLQLTGGALWGQSPRIDSLFPARPVGYVNDFASVVDPRSSQAMEDLIGRLRAATGAEIAVVTLPGIGDYDEAQVALAIGRKWKVGASADIGDATRNAGIVLLLVPRIDHRPGSGHIRIEVGQGLEGFVTDAAAGGIRSDVMGPHLANEEYGPALVAGVQALAGLIARGYGVTDSALTSSAPDTGAGRPPPQLLSLLPIILFVVFVALANRGRRGRRRVYWGGPWIGGGWGGGGGFGGGGFGGGGGGFGGFGGGGGFSGGGAGGRF